jgi:hypothetical protein
MTNYLHYDLATGKIVGTASSNAPPQKIAGCDFIALEDGAPRVTGHTHAIDLTTKLPVALTAAQLAAANVPTLAEVKAAIVSELSASDKTQLADYPLDPSTRQAWASYRQALRDLSKISPLTAAAMLMAWPHRPDGINPVASLQARIV